MAQLSWSPRAVQDLEDICEFIARTSDPYARVFAARVTALAESVPDQPLLGSVVPEYGQEDLRERLFQNYRVIYRVRGTDVEIVSVIHGARRLPVHPPG